MTEFVSEAVAFVNLPLTGLFGFVVLYWGLVCLGALDSDAFDLDLDLDANAEGAGGKLGYAMAHFFHCDEGPFMAIISLLTVFLWMGAMLLNFYFNPGHSWLLAGALFIPNAMISVVLTKAVVYPIFRVLRRIKVREESSSVAMLGQICRVVTLTVDGDSGQAEIERHGAPLKINVRVGDDACPLKKGDSAVIFFENEENNTYLIRKLED